MSKELLTLGILAVLVVQGGCDMPRRDTSSTVREHEITIDQVLLTLKHFNVTVTSVDHAEGVVTAEWKVPPQFGLFFDDSSFQISAEVVEGGAGPRLWLHVTEGGKETEAANEFRSMIARRLKDSTV